MYRMEIEMKNNPDNKEHPEVKDIKNICDVSPATKDTKNVCDKINDEPEDTANPGNKYTKGNQKPETLEKKGINKKPKIVK